MAFRQGQASFLANRPLWNTEIWAKAQGRWCARALVIKEAVFEMQCQPQDPGVDAQSQPGVASGSIEDRR